MSSSILISLASIALALLFYFQAADYQLAAQRLPMLLAWVVIVLAMLVIAEDVLKVRRAGKASAAAPDADAVAAPPPVVWSAVLPFGAGIVAYVALIPVGGYLLITPVFIAAVLIISRTLRPVLAILVALCVTAFVWLIFIWALRMPIQLLPFNFA